MTETEHSADTEERILEAALHVFSKKGKDGARTQEIADQAGINKALLHYYFRSKDRLYDSVFEYMLSKLTQSFGTSLQEAGSFDELLRLFIDQYIDFVSDNTPIMRLMVSEHLAGGERIAQRLQHLMRQEDSPQHVFLESLKQAGDRGEIRSVDPHQTLVTILSTCIFFFLIFPTVRTISPVAAQDPDLFVAQRKEHVHDLISTWLTSHRNRQPLPTG